MHYRQAGISGPWLVLIHQTMNSSRMWDRIMPLLAENFRVVAFDLPGYGMSDAPPARPSAEDYAQVVLSAMDDLEIAGACVAGFHAGSAIATTVATLAPERVAAMVLLGVPLFPLEMRQQRIAARRTAFEIDPDREYLAKVGAIFKHDDLEVRHRETVDMLLAGPNTYWLADAIFAIDLERQLAGLRCPVLVAVATSDFLAESCPAACALIPDVECHTFEGPMLLADARPAEIAALILDFVSRRLIS